MRTEEVPVFQEQYLSRYKNEDGRLGHIRTKELTVHIAESAGLALLGVMQATSPVDGDIALITTQACGALWQS